MRVLGIDPGIKTTGLVVIEQNKLIYFCDFIPEQKLSLQNKFLIIATRVEDIVMEYDPDYIICEEPFLKGKANKTMNRLLGAILALCPHVMDLVHPISVKAFFKCVKKDKKALAQAIRRYFTKESQKFLDTFIKHEQWDITDAVAIALYGSANYNKL